MISNFPMLYKRDSKGKIRQWEIWCDDSSGIPSYIQRHGCVDGALQTTSTEIACGKNIGRSNETTPWEQCIFDAESLWKKKQNRKGYSTTMQTAADDTKSTTPMLAKSYNVPGTDLAVLKDGKKITFPCCAQPKLDGIRCLASVQDDGTVVLVSRQQKVFQSLTHIQGAVEQLKLPVGTVLDGELYVHGEAFQELASIIKRDKPSERMNEIEYHIYDVISDEGYKHRYNQLLGWVDTSDCLKLVEYYVATDTNDVHQLHGAMVESGYEGIMLRNYAGPYKNGGRSSDLQKVKSFQDEEFEIVGAFENKGKQAGQCTLECITKAGTKFGVKPNGSETVRSQYWTDWQAGKLKGKMLTVRFFSWTTSGNAVPRFPVGIAVRDYE